ncbi:MAG: response regulator transcription factor [Chloroflexi bacterium]|nr:response regulator transcription factor [Chloroflexota bacterium]
MRERGDGHSPSTSGAGQTALIADDDRVTREIVRQVLQRAGYRVVACRDGREVLQALRDARPDVVLLDIVMPNLDGYQVCVRIRESSNVPIIMLTSLGNTDDIVRGLEAGADDYLVKPFEPRELLARIAAVVRRTTGRATQRQSVVRVGDLEVDRGRRRVRVHGKDVVLSPTEFELLYFLASNPGLAVDRQELLSRVWGSDYSADTKLVDVCVRRLRQKIEDDPSEPSHILTVRGVGYTLAEPTPEA